MNRINRNSKILKELGFISANKIKDFKNPKFSSILTIPSNGYIHVFNGYRNGNIHFCHRDCNNPITHFEIEIQYKEINKERLIKEFSKFCFGFKQLYRSRNLENILN